MQGYHKNTLPATILKIYSENSMKKKNNILKCGSKKWKGIQRKGSKQKGQNKKRNNRRSLFPTHQANGSSLSSVPASERTGPCAIPPLHWAGSACRLCEWKFSLFRPQLHKAWVTRSKGYVTKQRVVKNLTMTKDSYMLKKTEFKFNCTLDSTCFGSTHGCCIQWLSWSLTAAYAACTLHGMHTA